MAWQDFQRLNQVVISEYEPVEAFTLLTDDDLDLALTYDYNLAPAAPGPLLETVPLWSIPWGLGVPSDEPNRSADVSAYADRTWIVNSRNTADENAVRTLGALAGFAPRIAHQIYTQAIQTKMVVRFKQGEPMEKTLAWAESERWK